MPIGPVGHQDVAVGLMFVADSFDLHMRRKNIHDNPVVERNNPRAHLWSSDAERRRGRAGDEWCEYVRRC
jgi:hypothetical protein